MIVRTAERFRFLWEDASNLKIRSNETLFWLRGCCFEKVTCLFVYLQRSSPQCAFCLLGSRCVFWIRAWLGRVLPCLYFELSCYALMFRGSKGEGSRDRVLCLFSGVPINSAAYHRSESFAVRVGTCPPPPHTLFLMTRFLVRFWFGARAMCVDHAGAQDAAG